MNYRDLKTIMSHIRSKIKCPSCKNAFKDFNLDMANISDKNCVCIGVCPQCNIQMLIETQILPDLKPIKKEQIQIRTHKNNPVAEKEVTDMHNFLQGFNGDFKKLFTKQK